MNKFLKIIPAIFLALFVITLTSATCGADCSLNTHLVFEGTASVSKTITQGDSVTIVSTAYSYGQALSSETLILMPLTILNSNSLPGVHLGNNKYLYVKTSTLDSTTISLGTHTLRFLATNNKESEYSELTLIVKAKPDTIKPIVEITNPTEGNIYSSHVLKMDFKVTEENLDYCEYKTDNTNWKTYTTQSNQNTITSLHSILGTNNWKVRCYDKSGNIGLDEVTFTVKLKPSDTTDPMVDITNPVSQIYTTHRIKLQFDVFDKNLKSCTYSLNNGPQINITGVSNGEETVSRITSVPGSNTWRVTCEDNAGNTGTDSVQFVVKLSIIDDTDPVVKITNPTDGETYISHRTIITFNANDKNLKSCTYSLNGAAEVSISNIFNGINFARGITSIIGKNTWKITCLDDAGNSGSDTVVFTIKLPIVDNIAPVVKIGFPENGKTYYTHKNKMIFNVIEENLDYCTYTINGGNEKHVISEVKGSNTINYVSSVMGINIWTVTCKDNKGNTGKDSTTFIIAELDNEAPVVKITNPVGGTIYNSHRTELTFTVDDDDLDSCLYGLASVASLEISGVATGENTVSQITSSEGMNIWAVVCVDKSGNIGADVVAFTVLETPNPQDNLTLTPLNPTDGEKFEEDEEIIFKAITNKNAIVTYSIECETPITMTKVSDFKFNSNKRDFNEGEYTVKFCATAGTEKVCKSVNFKVEEDCDDKECKNCRDTRSSNKRPKEVVSSDPAPVAQYINRPAFIEEEIEEQAQVKITFGEQMFYGIIALILLMMVLAAIMFIAEQKMRK